MMRLSRLRAHRWRDAAYVHVDENECMDVGMMQVANGSQMSSMSWTQSLFSLETFRS